MSMKGENEMSHQSPTLFDEALKMNVGDRADLAALLYSSLDDADALLFDQDFEQEIARRIESIDQNKAKMIPWAEARKRIFGHV